MHIFLDFDGCLHPQGTPALDEDFRPIDNPALFQWLPILERILAPFPDVKIIISSDWRALMDDPTLIRLLGSLGPRFDGVVEIRRSPRAEELLLEATRRGLEHWIALDDHTSVRESDDPRFVRCDPLMGISDPNVQAELEAKLRTMRAGK